MTLISIQSSFDWFGDEFITFHLFVFNFESIWDLQNSEQNVNEFLTTLISSQIIYYIIQFWLSWLFILIYSLVKSKQQLIQEDNLIQFFV